jgi:hypothetical protein
MVTKSNLGGVSRTVWERARAVAFLHGQFLVTLVVLRNNQNLLLKFFSNSYWANAEWFYKISVEGNTCQQKIATLAGFILNSLKTKYLLLCM